MWPRDLLPEKFEKAGLRGRFSTVGYNANIVRGAGTTTIESAAKDLLYQLQHDRPENSKRPIYFVAHSLGGLVVAQVLQMQKPFFLKGSNWRRL
jgi:predicted alpha/beta-fold hydrolase